MDKEARRVSRAITLALALIAEQDPELAWLLRKRIKTGQYLSYSAVTGEFSAQTTARTETALLPAKGPAQPGGR